MCVSGKGDSGGPLMTTSGTLVGIVSWGYGKLVHKNESYLH